MATNEDMRELWNGEATSSWVQDPDRYDHMLAPFTEQVLDTAELQPGERVVDIGCGSGAHTRAAATRVGPDGRATGVDISAPLIALGRQRAAEAGLDNVEFVEGDAQVDEIPGAPHDVVTSRFGVMFFEDPTAAFTNIRSATADAGGRLAAVVWQGLDANEWAMIPAMAIIPILGMPEVPQPGAPGPFAFADRDHLRTVLADAGWTGIDIEPTVGEVLVAGGGSLDEAVAYYRDDAFGRALFAAGDDDQRVRATAALRATLEPHMTDEGLRLGSAAWLVTART